MSQINRLKAAILCAAIVVGFSCICAVRADDGEVEKQLSAKGATFTKTKDAVTSVQIADSAMWTEEDFKALARLPHLNYVDVSAGLTDQQAAWLSTLPELASIQTNKAQVTDAGIKAFLNAKKLRGLKFFHPGKAFTGIGLARLADLPSLQTLTVAGSDSVADEAMAAVAKLHQLREFRCWHDGVTNAGIARLKELSGLKSINLGQRLSYKPPTALDDGTPAVLAEMKSLESITLNEARLKLTALEQLKQLPNLKTLTLEGIDIPEADVEQLKKDLPKVKIEWTKPPEKFEKRIKALFGEK